MPRVLTIALSHIETRTAAFPSFERLRKAVANATKVDAAAASIYADNQAIRGTSRGWMI